MGDLDKLIVALGFKKLPKVQEITQFGHTDSGVGGGQQFFQYLVLVGSPGPTPESCGSEKRRSFLGDGYSSLGQSTKRYKLD